MIWEVEDSPVVPVAAVVVPVIAFLASETDNLCREVDDVSDDKEDDDVLFVVMSIFLRDWTWTDWGGVGGLGIVQGMARGLRWFSFLMICFTCLSFFFSILQEIFFTLSLVMKEVLPVQVFCTVPLFPSFLFSCLIRCKARRESKGYDEGGEGGTSGWEMMMKTKHHLQDRNGMDNEIEGQTERPQ